MLYLKSLLISLLLFTFVACGGGIGMETPVPSVENIMKRVAVTHDWMGERFEELLKTWPSEVRLLFRGTTGIVIARNIRPSFFRSDSGAIYLDPQLFWLTNQEKDTIAKNDDPRDGNDSVLNFKLRTYLVNGPAGGIAYYSPGLNGDEERIFTDIEVLATAIIVHELAHANDYFSQSRIGSFLLSDTADEASIPTITADLYASSALSNQELISLGDVLYSGKTASVDERNISPTEYGVLFETEGAVMPYSYSTEREDTATLFEASMLKHLYDVDIAVASMSVPYSFNNIVPYGHFNRLGANVVRPRAELVTKKILPELDWDSFFLGLDAEESMNTMKSLNVNVNGEPVDAYRTHPLGENFVSPDTTYDYRYKD